MEIRYRHAKIANSSIFFGGIVKFFVALVPRVRPEHIRPGQEPEQPVPHASHCPGSERKVMDVLLVLLLVSKL
jgi:hypothetical protein